MQRDTSATAHIRSLQPDDLAHVQALVHHVVHVTYGHLWAELPADLVATDWAGAWVAERDRTVLGVARTSGPDLEDLWVHPAAQGQGIGSALLLRCESEIRGRGYPEARLRVVGTNQRAQHLYVRHGWRFENEVPHETLPTRMLLMSKQLGPLEQGILLPR